MKPDFRPLDAEEKVAILARNEPLFTPQPSVGKLLTSNLSIMVGVALLTFIVLMALLGPLFSPYTYDQTDLPHANLPPSPVHLFGTDELGRDLFTRVCVGLRISLQIGLIAALVDLVIGVTWGLIAGLSRASTDHMMMRLAEMIYCLPYLLFVILMTVIMGPGLTPIITGMVLISWIQMARITRNLVKQIRECEFYTSAISLGVNRRGLIFRHILPNISGPIACIIMLSIPQAIFAEAFLSFLGIGLQPPLASLGSLVSDALSAMRYYPWRLFIPSVMITLTIFSFNLLGDGLRDLFDPQARRQDR